LSIAKKRRQRGKEDKNSDLLIEPDAGESRDVDMVVAGEEGDQGQQDPGQNGDPALKIQSQHQHRQPASPAGMLVQKY
jgi:hypothetical protein